MISVTKSIFLGRPLPGQMARKIEQLLPENVMTVRITVDSDTARTFEID